jgi:starch phosphorylase
MKVLVNGGLILSELDGWWAEAYSPDIGWALGDGKEHDGDPSWRAKEASALYDILENEVIPEFYTRDATGFPNVWLQRMRESMATLTPHFSATRAVREYTEHYYVPAAHRYLARSSQQSAIGCAIAAWSELLQKHWAEMYFETVQIMTDSTQHTFAIHLFLGELDPTALQVELHAEGAAPYPLTLVSSPTATVKTRLFQGSVPAHRPSSDYTPRVIPANIHAVIPLEAPYILWYR